MNTLEIFPTKIFTFDWDGDVHKILEKAIINQKDLGGSFAVNGSQFYDVSQSDSNVLSLFPDLSEFIHDCLSEVKEYHNLECDGLKVTTSWINRYRTKSILPWHRHPMSAFSGVFFINDKGRLSFKDPVQFRLYESIMPLSGESKYSDVDTKPGTIVIFPWWLEHAALNEDPIERWSLSFNSMPYGSINTRPKEGDMKYVPHLSSANIEIK